jgi:TRAP-type C4-dicarboxylate transport system permease small subunit
MAMAIAIVVVVLILAFLAFIGWVIYRAVKGKVSVKAHMISYGIAVVTGIFTYAYFLSMDFSQLIKIVASIFIGIILIVIGALLQRRLASRS